MRNARIDITQGLDGEPVVLALLDLDDGEAGAAAHAVRAVSGERFRGAELTVDDVLELRELTALADELEDHAARAGLQTLVLRPARLSALHDALTQFVEARDAAEWLREDDREPVARVRELLWPLGDLRSDALRAALSAASHEPTPGPCGG